MTFPRRHFRPHSTSLPGSCFRGFLQRAASVRPCMDRRGQPPVPLIFRCTRSPETCAHLRNVRETAHNGAFEPDFGPPVGTPTWPLTAGSSTIHRHPSAPPVCTVRLARMGNGYAALHAASRSSSAPQRAVGMCRSSATLPPMRPGRGTPPAALPMTMHGMSGQLHGAPEAPPPARACA